MKWAWAILAGLALGCTPPPPVTSQAAMLTARGRPDQAAGVLRARLVDAPGDVDARRELIRVLGVLRRVDEATTEAERLAGILGDGSPVPWVELGHAFELARRYPEALELYDRAASVAPTDPLGPRTGGLRAARWGEVDWAEPRLTEATRRDASDATTWHVLGLVRVHQGRLKEAEDAYRSGLVASPRSFENRVGLATLALRRNDLASALREYDFIAAEWPDQPDVQLGRAYVLWRMGEEKAAEEALERARAAGADPKALARLERAVHGTTAPPSASANRNP
jgi:tetratricopeptide (TPR) repeat protein